ncbi:diacylglycerol/lipid kinase family protein [Kineococcus gynurae]|uniref:Diacylglycerol/lipid kinase family protein n=1 Tax=Kineococcus gynurae TaxID=452979 RepID=A0ABV5LWM8_9ACTN
MSDDEPRGILAVANAKAGTAKAAVLDAVMRELARHADAELRLTETLEDLRDTLLDPGGRRLVLMGGDGTVHTALQLLHDAGAADAVGPLGLIPLGTGNDLARSLRLPLEPVTAAVVAATGTPRGLELLVDDLDRVTVNTVHAGIGASATARAQRWKSSLGAAAYPVGAAWAGVSAGRGYPLRVEVDGEVLVDGDRPVLMVGVGIGGTIGGGAPLVPGADPHDGVADVVVSTSTSPWARVGFARGLRQGVHVERQDVTTARGHVVEVSARSGHFRLNSDGEVGDPRTSVRWEMRADAWRAVCPR